MATTFLDLDTMARTVFGEARGESDAGKIAVAHVILNRAKVPGKTWWGDTIAEVCHKPWQFSCWNPGDPNREAVEAVTLDDPVFRACVRACLAALDGADPTGGATHYHVRGLSAKWARGKTPCATIGNHLFYCIGPS